MAFWTMKLQSSSGGSVTISTPNSGTIDGVNTTFGFASSTQPTFVVSDGASFRVGHGWTWNSGSMTVTMNVPPQYDLYSFS